MIRRALRSENQDMRTVIRNLTGTLSALGIAALTLLGVHRH
jgi:hypothetical protein